MADVTTSTMSMWGGGQPHDVATGAVLDAICARAREGSGLSDDMLAILHVLFHKTLVSALDLVDHATVLRIRAESGPRTFVKVQSTSKNVYHIFGGYCSCQSFAHKAVRSAELPLCKHILAARLAEAQGCLKEQTLDDHAWGLELLRGCGEGIVDS